MENALNDQINLELQSAYSYLDKSLDMAHACFVGAVGWLRHQYEEEFSHAFRIIRYVQDRMTDPFSRTIAISRNLPY